MIRIDKLVQVCSVLALELFDQRFLFIFILLVQDCLYVPSHLFGDLGIGQSTKLCKTLYLTIFFARDFAKELPAFADFFDSLLEWYRHPFILPTFTRSLKHFSQAIWIIGSLKPCLALGTD